MSTTVLPYKAFVFPPAQKMRRAKPLMPARVGIGHDSLAEDREVQSSQSPQKNRPICQTSPMLARVPEDQIDGILGQSSGGSAVDLYSFGSGVNVSFQSGDAQLTVKQFLPVLNARERLSGQKLQDLLSDVRRQVPETVTRFSHSFFVPCRSEIDSLSGRFTETGIVVDHASNRGSLTLLEYSILGSAMHLFGLEPKSKTPSIPLYTALDGAIYSVERISEEQACYILSAMPAGILGAKRPIQNLDGFYRIDYRDEMVGLIVTAYKKYLKSGPIDARTIRLFDMLLSQLVSTRDAAYTLEKIKNPDAVDFLKRQPDLPEVIRSIRQVQQSLSPRQKIYLGLLLGRLRKERLSGIK